MIEEGLAFPYFGFSNIKRRDTLKRAFIRGFSNRKNLYASVLNDQPLNTQLGKTGWYRGKINTVNYGEKITIMTDAAEISLNGKFLRKKEAGQASTVYAYGKLHREKDRYVIKVDKPFHLVVE
jgi:hypothetical protein